MLLNKRILPDPRITPSKLLVDVPGIWLADNILDSVNNELRVHKHKFVQLRATTLCIFAIVQHRSSFMEETQRSKHLVLVHPGLPRFLNQVA